MFSFRLLQFFLSMRLENTHPYADRRDKIIFWNQYFQKNKNCIQKSIGKKSWMNLDTRPNRIESNQMKRNTNKNFQCHNEKQEIKQKKTEEAYWTFIS